MKNLMSFLVIFQMVFVIPGGVAFGKKADKQKEKKERRFNQPVSTFFKNCQKKLQEPHNHFKNLTEFEDCLIKVNGINKGKKKDKKAKGTLENTGSHSYWYGDDFYPKQVLYSVGDLGVDQTKELVEKLEKVGPLPLDPQAPQMDISTQRAEHHNFKCYIYAVGGSGRLPDERIMCLRLDNKNLCANYGDEEASNNKPCDIPPGLDCPEAYGDKCEANNEAKYAGAAPCKKWVACKFSTSGKAQYFEGLTDKSSVPNSFWQKIGNGLTPKKSDKKSTQIGKSKKEAEGLIYSCKDTEVSCDSELFEAKEVEVSIDDIEIWETGSDDSDVLTNAAVQCQNNTAFSVKEHNIEGSSQTRKVLYRTVCEPKYTVESCHAQKERYENYHCIPCQEGTILETATNSCVDKVEAAKDKKDEEQSDVSNIEDEVSKDKADETSTESFIRVAPSNTFSHNSYKEAKAHGSEIVVSIEDASDSDSRSSEKTYSFDVDDLYKEYLDYKADKKESSKKSSGDLDQLSALMALINYSKGSNASGSSSGLLPLLPYLIGGSSSLGSNGNLIQALLLSQVLGLGGSGNLEGLDLLIQDKEDKSGSSLEDLVAALKLFQVDQDQSDENDFEDFKKFFERYLAITGDEAHRHIATEVVVEENEGVSATELRKCVMNAVEFAPVCKVKDVTADLNIDLFDAEAAGFLCDQSHGIDAKIKSDLYKACYQRYVRDGKAIFGVDIKEGDRVSVGETDAGSTVVSYTKEHFLKDPEIVTSTACQMSQKGQKVIEASGELEKASLDDFKSKLDGYIESVVSQIDKSSVKPIDGDADAVIESLLPGGIRLEAKSDIRSLGLDLPLYCRRQLAKELVEKFPHLKSSLQDSEGKSLIEKACHYEQKADLEKTYAFSSTVVKSEEITHSDPLEHKIDCFYVLSGKKEGQAVNLIPMALEKDGKKYLVDKDCAAEVIGKKCDGDWCDIAKILEASAI